MPAYGAAKVASTDIGGRVPRKANFFRRIYCCLPGNRGMLLLCP